MSHRVLASLSAAAVVVAVVSLGAGPAVAQTDVPRTGWGQPNLQGVWDFRSLTPMQRPRELGEQEVFTSEEAAAFSEDAIRRRSRDSDTSDRAARVAQGDIIPYNDFWFDEGTSVTTNRTSLIVDPRDGRMPALTPAGQRRAEARREYAREHVSETWEDLSTGVRCIQGFNAGPPFTPSAYNNNMQLFQTPDHVVIVTEMVHTARIVPLDGRPPLDPDVHQWSGDSRGYWEGDTLVIETRNFDDKRRWRGTTESMRLVERLTRVDAETLVYEFTVIDPETWTSSWTASVPLVLNPEPMYEYACHEGNYSMPGMLGGQRAEERAAAEQP